MKYLEFIRGWWHVLSAAGICAFLAIGWVGSVNAHVSTDLTPTQMDQLYIRKDVQSETLKRIEQKIDSLNDKIDQLHNLVPGGQFDE